MNFEKVYLQYLKYAKKKQKTQSFETLSQRFKSHILPYFKNKNIEEISTDDILEWQEKILSYNFSNNYNRNLHFLLSGFFTYCCKYYSLEVNVASKIGTFKKKYEKDKHDFYTLKEFNQFIKFVENEIYKQFFYFMFFTGTRPGETMALRFSDLKDNYISITKTMDSHHHRTIGTPKTLSSIRNINIDNQLKKDLLKLKSKYILLYDRVDFDFYIFGGIKPLSPTTINRRKKIACEKAHIRPITLHQFRHSHATFLLNKGILINEVSRRLGHSKVSTTLDIYTHTSLEQEKRVINTLNSIRNNFFQTLSQRFNKIILSIKTFL